MNRMSGPIRVPITVGEPNWTSLELAVPACELVDFTNGPGRAGLIELHNTNHVALPQHWAELTLLLLNT